MVFSLSPSEIRSEDYYDWPEDFSFFCSALKAKAEKAYPDEYRRATKKYAYVDDYWSSRWGNRISTSRPTGDRDMTVCNHDDDDDDDDDFIYMYIRQYRLGLSSG